MHSPVAELLGDLAAVLRRLRLRWYVFGAQAAIAYGAVRVTGDVDVTVDLGSLATAAERRADQDEIAAEMSLRTALAVPNG
jgi:hypothetical protein